MILLFVPFTDESQLVDEGQPAEQAFNKHFSKCTMMDDYHEGLQRMLQAQSKVKQINEARKEEELPADVDVAVEEGIKLLGRLKQQCTMFMTWSVILLVFLSASAC